MSKGFIFLILLSITGLSSCCKKRVYCKAGELKIAFVGYPRSDIRAVSIRRYKTDVFNKALDSAQLNLNVNLPVVPNKKDTIWLSDYSTTGAVKAVTLGNDWNLTLTATGENFRISSIGDQGNLYQIEKCSGKETDCTNGVSHFFSNGVWHESDTYYIQK
jgi:hypothetical protein